MSPSSLWRIQVGLTDAPKWAVWHSTIFSLVSLDGLNKYIIQSTIKEFGITITNTKGTTVVYSLSIHNNCQPKSSSLVKNLFGPERLREILAQRPSPLVDSFRLNAVNVNIVALQILHGWLGHNHHHQVGYMHQEMDYTLDESLANGPHTKYIHVGVHLRSIWVMWLIWLPRWCMAWMLYTHATSTCKPNDSPSIS